MGADDGLTKLPFPSPAEWYRLQDAKKPETRARRLAKFVAMLETGETIYL